MFSINNGVTGLIVMILSCCCYDTHWPYPNCFTTFVHLPVFFLSSRLCDFDDLLKSILSHTLSTNFSDADKAWEQVQLPVKVGGAGIRSAVQWAASASLASAAGASDSYLKDSVTFPSLMLMWP